MKRVLLLLVFFTGIISFSFVIGQNVNAPNWIIGTWQNYYESNTNNFVFCKFSNDSIFFEKGLNLNEDKRKCLNIEYSAYKKTEISSDSLYQVNFSKDNQAIVYEFKLQKVDSFDNPVITYSLTINGISKVTHSTSCYLMLIKN